MTQVTGAGVVPATQLGPKLVIAKDAISLDGTRLVAIKENGEIDRTQLEALMSQLETRATSDAPIALTLDASLPYRRVALVLDALKRGGFRNLALLTGSGASMIPIELRDTEEANGAGMRPVVTVRKNHVLVWSVSGEEGTRAAPKLAYDASSFGDFAPVTHVLADIVQRHWSNGPREEADKTIILQLDGDMTAQDLLQLAAAVRADGSLMLFPGIYLAGG
jgi:biopolymer transport protein ExbD